MRQSLRLESRPADRNFMPHIWKDKAKTEISYKPDSKTGIIWGQELGDPECPYMKRWVLNFGKFSIRLHHWIGSDDPRYMHDHAWTFYTLVLKGGYTDVTECDLCHGAQIIDGDFVLCSKCNKRKSNGHFELRNPGIVKEHLGRGSFTYRPAHHKHTVQTDPGGAWTLLLVGPFKRKWGFYVDGEFVGVRKYFRQFGHHPCIDEIPND